MTTLLICSTYAYAYLKNH